MRNQVNPYKTPEARSVVREESLELIVAGKGARFLNAIIDWVAQIVFVTLFGVAGGLLGGEAFFAKLAGVPDIVLGYLAMLLYYIVMEGTFGRTVGKFITRTKVVDEAGGPPSFAQVLGRTLTRMLPLEGLTFFGAETRGLHDSLPKTYVTKCR